MHGGNVHALARKANCDVTRFADFSTNTHAFAQDVTARLIGDLDPVPSLYPDPDSVDLVRAIAAHEGCEGTSVMPGNGSAELIWLLMQALRPRHVLCIGPVFSEYARAAAAVGAHVDIITPSEDAGFDLGPAELNRVWASQADLLILCSPNNPGGVTYRNVPTLLDMVRIPRLLVDFTYREFLWGETDYASTCHAGYRPLLRPGVSLFALGSFTKFFAAPGIRLGYLVADPTQLRHVRAIQPPWSVNALSQQAGLRFLETIDEYRERLVPLRQARRDMGMALRRMQTFVPHLVHEGPSFHTCRLRDGLSPSALAGACVKRGILIRDCDSIPGMPPGYIRLQVKPADACEEVLRLLDWYGDHGAL